MRRHPVSSIGLAILFGLFRTSVGWYIYTEWTQNDVDGLGGIDQFLNFYETSPSCSTGEEVAFVDVEDVNDVPGNAARCDGCTSPFRESIDDPITEFEWYQKNGGKFGHHTFYLDRGGIFVDVNNVRHGTCVKDVSHSLKCQDGLVFTRTGLRLLSCTWDADLPPPPPPTPPPSPPLTPAIKVLIAGDSITHGMESDWTWRFRLYAWLTANGHRVNFVGPQSGTNGPAPPSSARPVAPPFPGESNPPAANTIGLYASGVGGSFLGSGHAGYWGRQAAQTKDTIRDWVSTYQPDYVLLLLGFNDLGWGVSDANGLLVTMKTLIDNARLGKSNIKIVIGNVVHRTFLREELVTYTNQYNLLLSQAVPGWSTVDSPITIADVSGNYDCNSNACADGYDGLHPNAKGEHHIAQAFARTLKDFGFGGADYTVPANIEPRTLSVPTGVTTISVPEGIFTGWNLVENARGYEIRSRLKGLTDWWSEGPVFPSTNAAYTTWVFNGQTWEFQVRATGDGDDKGPWSGLTSATVDLKTSLPPVNIVASPRPNGLQVTWDEVTGYSVYRYAVLLQDKDTPSYVGSYGASGTSFILDGLPLHRYDVWVATWVNLPGGPAGGLPSAAVQVTVGGSVRPPPPTNVEVFEYDAITIQLGWPASNGAQGYHIYQRPITQDNDAAFTRVATTVYYTTVKVPNLFPGAWNYQFCIAAYYGDLESDHSTACVKPPIYAGWPPAPPANLATFEFDATTIQLGWPSSNGATGYHVWQRPITQDNNAEFTLIFTLPYTTMKVENLFPGCWHYEFCVSAFALDRESDRSTACIKPPIYPGWPPSPPANLAAFEIDATTIQLGWPSSNGATGYHVWRRLITQDNNAEFTLIFTLPYTTMKVENLFPGCWHYEFCVSAFGSDNKESDRSTACIKPPIYPGWPPSPPASVAAFQFDAVSIQLGWPSSDGAEGYYVYSRYIPDNGGFTRSPAIPKYTTTGIGFLYPGSWHYEFCISAYAGGLESDHSTACVTPPVFSGSKRSILRFGKNRRAAPVPHTIVFHPGNSNSSAPSFNVTLIPDNTTSLPTNSTLRTLQRPSTTTPTILPLSTIAPLLTNTTIRMLSGNATFSSNDTTGQTSDFNLLTPDPKLQVLYKLLYQNVTRHLIENF